MNEKEKPAPRGNAESRAMSNVHAKENKASGSDLEVDFAAIYIARRFHLAAPLARVVVELARIGGAIA